VLPEALIAAVLGALGAPVAIEPPAPFVPSARREGDAMVLPVTFPDRTRAELSYPRSVDPVSGGVLPYAWGTLHGKSRWEGRSDFAQRDFFIRRGDTDDVLSWWNGGRPPTRLAEYRGADGLPVGFWDLEEEDDVHYLGFQFGGWAVLVYDYTPDGSSAGAEMSDAERAAWAKSFSGYETTRACAGRGRAGTSPLAGRRSAGAITRPTGARRLGCSSTQPATAASSRR